MHSAGIEQTAVYQETASLKSHMTTKFLLTGRDI